MSDEKQEQTYADIGLALLRAHAPAFSVGLDGTFMSPTPTPAPAPPPPPAAKVETPAPPAAPSEEREALADLKAIVARGQVMLSQIAKHERDARAAAKDAKKKGKR
jgi:hypothetical protein